MKEVDSYRLYELFSQQHDIAVAEGIEPEIDRIYRKIVRWFSKNFYTPIQQVEEMPPSYVLMHYFESNFDALDEDEQWGKIQSILNPSSGEVTDEELEQVAAQVEQELKGKAKPKKHKTYDKVNNTKKTISEAKKSFTEETPPEADGEGLDDLDTLGS